MQYYLLNWYGVFTSKDTGLFTPREATSAPQFVQARLAIS